MYRRLLALAACLAVFAPSALAEVSIGYAYLKYLGDSDETTPLGFYLSGGRSGAGTGLELDLAFHHDGDVSLNTFTATAGPRFRNSRGGFLHVLGGLRHDRFKDVDSKTVYGGMAGLGVDLASGGGGSIRLGADYQIFFDHGEKLKTLRFTAGFTF